MRAIVFEDWIVAGALLYRSNEFQSTFDKPRFSSATVANGALPWCRVISSGAGIRLLPYLGDYWDWKSTGKLSR